MKFGLVTKNDLCCWMILVYLGNVGSSECWPHPDLQTHFHLATGAYPFRGGSTVLWQSNLVVDVFFVCTILGHFGHCGRRICPFGWTNPLGIGIDINSAAFDTIQLWDLNQQWVGTWSFWRM